MCGPAPVPVSQPMPAQHAKHPAALQLGPDPPAAKKRQADLNSHCGLPQLPKICMLNTLSHLPGCSAAYIDDVIIFSPNWKTHIDHIQAVLDALRVAGLTANPLKCVWGAHSLEYLGHHVGMGKVRVPVVRVRAMKDYVRPTSQKGLRAFLGTAGYYQRFVPDFSR